MSGNVMPRAIVEPWDKENAWLRMERPANTPGFYEKAIIILLIPKQFGACDENVLSLEKRGKS